MRKRATAILRLLSGKRISIAFWILMPSDINSTVGDD
jgi:hypothetical protein